MVFCFIPSEIRVLDNSADYELGAVLKHNNPIFSFVVIISFPAAEYTPSLEFVDFFLNPFDRSCIPETRFFEHVGINQTLSTLIVFDLTPVYSQISQSLSSQCQ